MEEDKTNPAGEEVWVEAEASVREVIVSALNADTKCPMNEAVPVLKSSVLNAGTP